MAKSKTAPHPVPSDDSKVIGTAADNVLPIEGRRSKGSPAPRETSSEGAGASGPEPSFVVFGRDDGGKPHASVFGASEAELATRAAGLMRFKVLPIASDEHRKAASGLAAGRVFASGRAFSPFCREATYKALEAFPEAYTPPAPVEPEPVPPPTVTSTPQRWEDVDVGALVLANAGDEWGWHEAIVTEARGDDLLVLRWRDWPDEAAFPRRRDGVGLLPPSAAEPSAPAPADPAA